MTSNMMTTTVTVIRVTPLYSEWAGGQHGISTKGRLGRSAPEGGGGAEQGVGTWRDARHVGGADASKPRGLWVGTDEKGG